MCILRNMHTLINYPNMKYICTTPLTVNGNIPTLMASKSTTPDPFNAITTGEKGRAAHKLYVLKKSESKDLLRDVDTTILFRYLIERGHMKGKNLCNSAIPIIQDAIANLQSDELLHIEVLTPREKFRAMGVKDEDIEKLLNSGISDKNLSKMAGDSIVVPVLQEIFRKMFVEKGPE